MALIEHDFKYGITEFGDAAQNCCSWTTFLNVVIYAVIISRCANKEFSNKILDHKNKIIYHARMSGFGGTKFEKNVPPYQEIFDQIEYLIYHGFPPEQIVIDINPIMPYCWVDELNSILDINYLENIKNILYLTEKYNITRVRQEFLNFNPIILKNIKQFSPSLSLDAKWTYNVWDEIPLYLFNENLQYETGFPLNPFAKLKPITTNEDLKILKMDMKYRFNNDLDIIKNKLELVGKNAKCDCECVYCPLIF
jgi:hypothetical protein